MRPQSCLAGLGLIMALILTPSSSEARFFKMGFTDFPFEPTVAAVNETWTKLTALSDLVTFQMDDGVAWTESLYGLPFATEFQSGLQWRLSKVPAGMKKVVMANPLGFDRVSLALARGAQPNQPLDAFWKSQPLNSPYVKAAYLNFCLRLIATLKPDYFGLSIEGNVLFEKDPSRWAAFIELIYSTYAGIKKSYPNLPLTNSIQVESLQAGFAQRQLAARQLMLFSDYVSLSTYPYYLYSSYSQIPGDYWDRVIALGNGKPFAIAETGWPAEPITAPAPITVPGSSFEQGMFVYRLLNFAQSKGAQAKYVNYYMVKDYDHWWTTEMQYKAEAPLARLWKDIGMYGQDPVSPRFAEGVWTMVRHNY